MRDASDAMIDTRWLKQHDLMQS